MQVKLEDKSKVYRVAVEATEKSAPNAVDCSLMLLFRIIQ